MRAARHVEAVGREEQVAGLRALGTADSGAHAVVLTGEPGIGKTTLWEAGVDGARERGLRVLSARPSGAETEHSFAALIDLCEGIPADALESLPAPQRSALEVALLRAEPGGAAPEPRAIALGFLNMLRALAAAERLVVAVDDVQWLDAPSADALAFAARRLESESVAFLIAKRPGRHTALEQALERRGLQQVQVGPLSLGAVRRLLAEQLGLTVSRPQLRRILDSTLGNPLFALEIGRTLVEHGPREVGEDIPLPDALEDMLGARVARLPDAVRRVLLAVALSGDVRAADLEAIEGMAAVEDALDEGVLVADGDRMRASHPLLAVAARKRSGARERRELHLALAGTVADEELRALHLALATEVPDEQLAATLAAAAAGASARGARQVAVRLGEHAWRLTPPESSARDERLIELAGHLETAGEVQRMTSLLTPALDSLPHGALRGRVWLLLSEGSNVRDLDDLLRHLDAALEECGGDPGISAHALARKAGYTVAAGVSRIRQAEAWAQEAVTAARRVGPDLERRAIGELAWARALSGRPIDELCERFREASDAAFYIADSPERVAGQRLVWRGDVKQARVTLTRDLALADEQGEPTSYALQRLHVCELELRAGDWDAAAHILDEWAESADNELLIPPMYERCRALLAAGRGLPDETQQWAAKAIASAEATATRWDALEALRARGIAELLSHEPPRAVESLRAVWSHTLREGIDEPGVFPVAPELVEALVEVGERDEARAVTQRLRELAEPQAHPWGLATVKRCSAVVGLAGDTYDPDAAAVLAQAAADYDELGLRFDAARSLLSLGRAQRRFRKWGAARGSLEQATAAFERVGSPGWAERTRSELSRVGGRRPRASEDELTPSERRVVELAADGLANKEIAAALFVTVNTVEVHLSRAYGKLGVRSRSQLARRLADNYET